MFIHQVPKFCTVVNLKFIISVAVSVVVHVLVFIAINPLLSAAHIKASLPKNDILIVNFLSKPITSSDVLTSRVKSHEVQSSKNKIDEKTDPEKLVDLNKIPLLIPQVKYYKLSELDQKPSILSEIDNNPPELSKYSQGGEITVQLWINEMGYVAKAEIIKSELPGEFNKSALNSFQNAKFIPGVKNNLPVNSVAKIVIQYKAINSDH